LCGGGRYDDLLSLFGGEKVPAVGFGLGDVTAKDVMETYKTLPQVHSNADIYIAVISKEQSPFANDIAQDLRRNGKKVIVDFSYKKIGEQIKSADKRNVERLIVIGEEEVKTGKYKIKNLKTGKIEEN
jgi:histidyl-tRNA synthetase